VHALVTVRGERFTFRFGTARRPELTIIARAADRNVFMRPYGPGYMKQLRFVRGEQSYVLWSAEPSRVHSETGASGLMIFHNAREVGHGACTGYAELRISEWNVPEIPEDAVGAPLAWDEGS
jgi:hypothetical protein